MQPSADVGQAAERRSVASEKLDVRSNTDERHAYAIGRANERRRIRSKAELSIRAHEPGRRVSEAEARPSLKSGKLVGGDSQRYCDQGSAPPSGDGETTQLADRFALQFRQAF